MKHATKEMAITAKNTLEKDLFTPKPKWLKDIVLEEDDHGWFLTTKIKGRNDYTAANIKIPGTIDVNGFKVKNCIMILG